MVIQKIRENFFEKENRKRINAPHAFKDYASSYDIKLLNSFNMEVLEPRT